jgi:thiosulfate reductase cytochrome b subunit
MKWIGGLFGGGVAAFFFFSWIIQLLFNSIVVGHLGLLKPLNYWQAAGLWFLVTLIFAWVGIGATRGLYRFRREQDWERIGERIERKIKARLREWAEEDEEWKEVEEKIAAKIRKKIKEWAEEE